VCDVYDALRTKRPYRDAWPSTRALSYIEGRAGSEFDPALARVFVQMMREREGSVLLQPA
jgi:putative two-component system response regulator